jgi:hypothetical protein
MMDIALPRTTALRTETRIVQRMFAVLPVGGGTAPDAAAAAPLTAADLTASDSLAVAVKAAVTMSWTCCAFGAGGIRTPIDGFTDYIMDNAASKDLRTQPCHRVRRPDAQLAEYSMRPAEAAIRSRTCRRLERCLPRTHATAESGQSVRWSVPICRPHGKAGKRVGSKRSPLRRLSGNPGWNQRAARPACIIVHRLCAENARFCRDEVAFLKHELELDVLRGA